MNLVTVLSKIFTKDCSYSSLYRGGISGVLLGIECTDVFKLMIHTISVWVFCLLSVHALFVLLDCFGLWGYSKTQEKSGDSQRD